MIDQEIHWPITRIQNLIADPNILPIIIEINADLPDIQKLRENKAAIKAINQQLHDLGRKYWTNEYMTNYNFNSKNFRCKEESKLGLSRYAITKSLWET